MAANHHASIARRFGTSFESHQWAALKIRSGLARRIRPHHECSKGPCDGVFQCQDCKRFVGYCLGGSDDARCAKCWCKWQQQLKRMIVAWVRAAESRVETDIVTKFAQGDIQESTIEDALYDLVRERKLDWFGDNEKPLHYRISRGGSLASLEEVA